MSGIGTAGPAPEGGGESGSGDARWQRLVAALGFGEMRPLTPAMVLPAPWGLGWYGRPVAWVAVPGALPWPPAIINGRRVTAYDVLERIIDGLRIPRGLAGMAYCPDPSTAAADRDQETRRRILQSYARLRRDPESWTSYLAELNEWENLGPRPSVTRLRRWWARYASRSYRRA